MASNLDDFGLIDFTDEAAFCQFVDLIRGQSDHSDYYPSVNFDIQGYGGDQQSIGGDQFAPPVELFDFGMAANVEDINSDAVLDALLEAEGIMDVEDSSATASTTTAAAAIRAVKKKGNKSDRSSTLVSERKRRGRMKEKLYELRSLVPNITKMDKASIVGDAILYLQDLQMQIERLKSEISGLESNISFKGDDHKHHLSSNVRNLYPMIKKISKMDVTEVEDRGFYAKVVLNKEKGVAMLLYKALESLTISCFRLHSSNLTASAANYVFTFNFHIKGCELELKLPDLKLWIAGVFVDQGFDFEASVFHLAT